MENKQINKLQIILGVVLLIPPVMSVFFFLQQLFIRYYPEIGIQNYYHLQTVWTGAVDYNYDKGGGGGYTSALPLYFGLMAIAGALLIMNGNKK
ncbi:MAG: hypothetical protein IPQ03_13850 [Bacteroidetes bacterium]|nr:hypothetical protein [Bacteroidota bacterium]